MDSVEKEVQGYRKAAKAKRDKAIRNNDPTVLPDARSDLQNAITLLEPLIPARGSKFGDTDEKYTKLLYQCLGSMGGTWRDEAELESDGEQKGLCWDQSVSYYDEGYKIESGNDDRYPDFKFCDSYNLLQRLVARVLRDFRCLTDGDTKLGKGLNVPEELARAEREISDQVAEPSGPRKKDPWAWADYAEVLILRGKNHEAAWEKFIKGILSIEAYEANHRAYTSLVRAAEQAEPPPSWLPAARETVRQLSEKLKSLYEIKV